VGGATDLFEATRSGRMHALLTDGRVDFDRDARVDPYDYLPKWLHPRSAA
jgi:cysteine synthase A